MSDLVGKVEKRTRKPLLGMNEGSERMSTTKKKELRNTAERTEKKPLKRRVAGMKEYADSTYDEMTEVETTGYNDFIHRRRKIE
jgi:hypothetical protein